MHVGEWLKGRGVQRNILVRMPPRCHPVLKKTGGLEAINPLSL